MRRNVALPCLAALLALSACSTGSTGSEDITPHGTAPAASVQAGKVRPKAGPSDGSAGALSDVQLGSFGTSSTVGSLQSPAFSHTTAAKLVVVVATTGSTGQSVSGITSTGSGCSSSAGTLVWARVPGGRANAMPGTAEAWWAAASTSFGGSTPCRVTASLTQAAGGTIGVVAFDGADAAAPVGTAHSANSGTPGVDVNLTAGSIVYGVGQDWTGAATRTLRAGQSKWFETLGSLGDTWWAQRVNSATPANPYTVGTTAPTGRTYNMAGVVVSPATSPPVDTEPPSAPTRLTHSGVTSSSVDLAWTASTDNVGVTGYQVYRDGVAAGPVVTGTSTSLSGLTPATTYQFTVKARDAAGNWSTASAPDSVTTADPPAGGNNCLASPHTCGYPDATNTGPDLGNCPGGLQTLTGTQTLTAGQIMTCKDIRGGVVFAGSNAVLRDSKVTAACGSACIQTWGSPQQTGALIERVEIDMGGDNTGKGISGPNWTAKAVYFHNGADCAHAWSESTGANLVQDSYCELTDSVAGGAHVDGFQTDGGYHFHIVHNTVRQINNSTSGTSAIIIDSDLGPEADTVIDNNLLDGGGYTVYCWISRQYSSQGAVLTNNRFGPHHGYDYGRSCTHNTHTGNVHDVDGTPMTDAELG